MVKITDSDIAEVEKILLEPGELFDKERRDVIKCLESKDVLACPGSGKTTALLAKLLIIGSQLPLKDNKGICVLTHTNVAMDKIKGQIGIPRNNLFRYPNHFGTIQSFVDKFLAIPAYTNIFGRRPSVIDNDWYNEKVDRQFRYLMREAKHWCHKNERKGFPHTIRFHLKNSRLTEGINGKELQLDLNEKTDRTIYDSLLKMKERIMRDGILSFEDAYWLAHKYLSSYPGLAEVFSERFALVFIDEMQDTDTHQIELLNTLFAPTRVIIQRIGDINQSIYNAPKEEIVWDVKPEPLEINGSKRFSNGIANAIRSICLKPQHLEGNPTIWEIAPVILAFSDEKIKTVLPRFGDLIVRNNLHLQRERVFKAIGWTAKPHEKYHTLLDYWPGYKREVQTRRTEFGNLWNYVVPLSDEIVEMEGANTYRKSIIRALLRVLRLNGVSYKGGVPFNEKNILKYMSERDSDFSERLKIKLTDWCLEIHGKKKIWNEVKLFIETEFATFFAIDDLSPANEFLSNTEPEPLTQITYHHSNVFEHSPEVRIDVSTIHGVKGETHTATLYLETIYYDYNVKRIIEYLKGNHPTPTQSHMIQNLRMSYVGMSRPSHFLCLAVHKGHIIGHEKGLIDAGWELDYELV